MSLRWNKYEFTRENFLAICFLVVGCKRLIFSPTKYFWAGIQIFDKVGPRLSGMKNSNPVSVGQNNAVGILSWKALLK